MKIIALALPLLGCATQSPPPVKQPVSPNAETVLVTYLPKAGQDAALQQEINATWQDMRRLHLVASDDRTFYRGDDDDSRPFFVEIFSWKDRETPDHAPPEIEAHWKKLTELVEARGPRPGLQFAEVHPVEQL